ncbi:MAG: DUF805 domain-containing protein [Henriciella sp.]
MGMSEALRLFISNYTNFQGRSRRSEYWWVVLAVAVVFGVGGIIAMAIGGGFSSSGQLDLNPIGYLLLGILGIAYLGIIIPMIALMVRRFHDLNQTGWLVLVFFVLGLIPLVSFFSGIGQLIWFCMPGTAGPNKYGEDPKGGVDVGAFD